METQGFRISRASEALNREAGPLPTLLALALFVAMIATFAKMCGA